MDDKMVNQLIDAELINLNKLVYELKGAYAIGDPKLIYFKMQERLEMLEKSADWTRIIQSRLDNNEDVNKIVTDFVDFVDKRFGEESLRWFYRHLEVNDRQFKNRLFSVVRRRPLRND